MQSLESNLPQGKCEDAMWEVTASAAKCRVFTPSSIVTSMLDSLGYRGNLYGRRILENSFGQGSFLCEIVNRYIDCAKGNGYSQHEIQRGLERDIVGYEVNGQYVLETRSKLDSIALKHGLQSVNWDLRAQDYLKSFRKERFSFIVGNPPYLEYKAIKPEYRAWMKEHFDSCKSGKFDYCYAFVEAALEQLEDNGCLAQIVPGSLFKNVFGKQIRDRLKPGIVSIVDYAGQDMAWDALVSPCVFKYVKGSIAEAIDYRLSGENDSFRVRKEGLGDKWLFSFQGSDSSATRFGDLFVASMPVATLCNDAFLLGERNDVESEITKPAYSPRLSKSGRERAIIFPYRNSGGEITRYEEAEFEKKFPRATAHLRGFSERLSARRADNSASWFEYGRSQGLRRVPEEKLLMSTVVTNRASAYELEEDTVPFAGIVITRKDDDADLSFAKRIIESEEFSDYAYRVGTSVSGSSVRITCRDVENYRFTDSG